MTKVFCDNVKCGKEIKDNGHTASIYDDGKQTETVNMDLCVGCAKALKLVLKDGWKS